MRGDFEQALYREFGDIVIDCPTCSAHNVIVPLTDEVASLAFQAPSQGERIAPLFTITLLLDASSIPFLKPSSIKGWQDIQIPARRRYTRVRT